MSRKLKVYAWSGFPREFNDKECRCIMACRSIKRLAELKGVSAYFMSYRTVETQDAEERELALSEPEQMFAGLAAERPLRKDEYRKVSNR